MSNKIRDDFTFGNAVYRVLITEEDEVVRGIDNDVCTHYIVPVAVMDEEFIAEIKRLRLQLIEADGGFEEQKRETKRLTDWMVLIDGGDAPFSNAAQLRSFAFKALRGDEVNDE